MREVVTADAVFRALKDKGADARLIYIADTLDPLRKCIRFLPKDYENHVGKPFQIFRVPAEAIRAIQNISCCLYRSSAYAGNKTRSLQG